MYTVSLNFQSHPVEHYSEFLQLPFSRQGTGESSDWLHDAELIRRAGVTPDSAKPTLLVGGSPASDFHELSPYCNSLQTILSVSLFYREKREA